VARPLKEIDEHVVYELAKIQCTMIEIAAVCKCSVDTLENRFSDVIKRGKEEGKTSLRRHLWKMVEAGNTGVAIWLSKQYLGMSDKVEQNSTQTQTQLQLSTSMTKAQAQELLNQALKAKDAHDASKKG
jgi:hypothetical protein